MNSDPETPPSLPERATEIDGAGLVRDEQSTHAERLKLWDDFNTCWLAILQVQMEMTEQVQGGQNPSSHQTMLSYEYLETMGKELVRQCDIMEKHGLVDYQMGIWEEEIVSSTHRLPQ